MTQLPNHKCWDEAIGVEPDAPNVFSYWADDAAAAYGEMLYEVIDKPRRQTICVRNRAGLLTRWHVEAVPSVVFKATAVEVRQPRQAGDAPTTTDAACDALVAIVASAGAVTCRACGEAMDRWDQFPRDGVPRSADKGRGHSCRQGVPR